MKTRTNLGTARATWKRAAKWLVTLAGALALATTAWAQKGGKPGGGGGNQGNPAIVYVGNGDLKVMDEDGGNQRRVLKASGYYIRNPSWYPDGQRILFYREKSISNPDGFYRVNLDGTGLTRIMTLEGSLCCRWFGEVSPFPGAHGQYRIAFMDLRPDQCCRGIYLVNEDGTDLTYLTPGREGWEPTWSPDGHHLAYYDDNGLRLITLGEDLDGNVWVEDDTLLLANATDDNWNPAQPFHRVSNLSFSKIGNKIYLHGENYFFDSIKGLFALEVDDLLNPVLLTQLTFGSEYSVSGSPDDSQIVYQRDGTIYVANSDGSDPVALPKGKNESQRYPSFKR